jgi:hypothetical protein
MLQLRGEDWMKQIIIEGLKEFRNAIIYVQQSSPSNRGTQSGFITYLSTTWEVIANEFCFFAKFLLYQPLSFSLLLDTCFKLLMIFNDAILS